MAKKSSVDEKQPFLSHLKELRDRIIVCIVAVGIAFILTYSFKEKIFAFLMEPFILVMPAKSSFIFTGVTEAFITYFKISIVAALFIVAPVILYEFWMFVSPGLYEKEKRYVYPFIFLGSLCFICGGLFCYYVVMPFVYRFFVSYAGELIIPMPDLKSYMSLTLKMLIMFGLFFELPLVAYYLARAGIIRYKMLANKRRYAILGAVITSAIITPPDVSSQLLVAIPLWGLYELSVIIVRVFGKKERADEKA
ncbi:MAG TPA: twin-arginine translocase subunit TatC [Syntrophorhabdaceae bacterium]|nr:twin-arginine translocase subunit TatC [Syntrophorhabdaceae bacterium]HQM81082.1 twin-arginine translocase subunit TatC [Syntrophorhabdaceae bacterium]